jgi:hypothetical protein
MAGVGLAALERDHRERARPEQAHRTPADLLA